MNTNQQKTYTVKNMRGRNIDSESVNNYSITVDPTTQANHSPTCVQGFYGVDGFHGPL